MPRPRPRCRPHGAPLWILALWAAFALTLTRSLAWLMRRPWLAALFGAARRTARLCERGARLRARSTSRRPPARAVAGLALGWGAAMAVLAYLARRDYAGARGGAHRGAAVSTWRRDRASSGRAAALAMSRGLGVAAAARAMPASSM